MSSHKDYSNESQDARRHDQEQKIHPDKDRSNDKIKPQTENNKPAHHDKKDKQ